MATKDYVESGLSMVGGICLGAGLMYLLDPALGPRRRRQIRRKASETWESTGKTAGSAIEGISRYARDLGENISQRVNLPQSSADVGGRLRRRFYRATGGLGELAGRYTGLERRSAAASALRLTLTAVGALAVGAGLMFVLDPQQGRRRRALARDKVIRASHQTSDAVRKSSQYVGDHARGMFNEAKARFSAEGVSDQQLIERVRSKIGRAISNPGSIEVGCGQGTVTLSGPILASEVDHLIATARSIRGVRHVENRLEVHQTANSIPGLQGAQP